MLHRLRPAGRPLRRPVRAALAALLALALAGAVGCGGDDEPSYCSKRSTLEQAAKGLPDAAKSGGTSGLQAQVEQVKSDANAMIDAAKSDFPSETSTLKTSVSQLETAIEGLPSDPSATQLAAIAIDATAVVNAVKDLTSATQSACD